MKNCPLFLLFLLIGCQETSYKSTSNEIEENKIKPSITLIENIDTVQLDTPKVEQTPEIIFNPNGNSEKLKKLLENPLDLVAFKKAMKSANSGGHDKLDYFFQPKVKGFYYRYFVFRGCEVERLKIVVYKEGTKVGRWEDENEHLIAIENDCELVELKALNLVGKSFADIKAMLGENYIKKGSYIIYAEKGNLLILKFVGFQEKKVSRLKYLKTNLNIVSSEDLQGSILVD